MQRFLAPLSRAVGVWIRLRRALETPSGAGRSILRVRIVLHARDPRRSVALESGKALEPADRILVSLLRPAGEDVTLPVEDLQLVRLPRGLERLGHLQRLLGWA